MNYIYSFIIFEAGAFFGFFVAALLNAARAGQEITIKFEEEDAASADHMGRWPDVSHRAGEGLPPCEYH